MVRPSPSHGLQHTKLQASSITLFIKLHDKNKILHWAFAVFKGLFLKT